MFDLDIHEILEIHKPLCFRVMRVPSGWLYNFYDTLKDEYKSEWIFVPQ